METANSLQGAVPNRFRRRFRVGVFLVIIGAIVLVGSLIAGHVALESSPQNATAAPTPSAAASSSDDQSYLNDAVSRLDNMIQVSNSENALEWADELTSVKNDVTSVQDDLNSVQSSDSGTTSTDSAGSSILSSATSISVALFGAATAIIGLITAVVSLRQARSKERVQGAAL